MNRVLSHPGGDFLRRRSMLLRASIRLRRVSRSRTSAIFSRRTRLQLIRSRLSILFFVSSSTRTVTSGTDDIPSIMYICLLRTSAASTVNRLVRPAFLTTGVPGERPDHHERRDEQRSGRKGPRKPGSTGRLAVCRTQPAAFRAIWKVAMRSKPSTRVNRGSMRQVPGWDIANVVRKK